MRKTIVTIIAASGLALGTFAQGTIDLSNQASGGFVLQTGGVNYGGPLTIEVWVLPNGSMDGTISGDLASANTMHSAVLGASTFGAPDATVSGSTLSGGDGIFNLGPVALPHVALGANASMAWVMFSGSQWGQAGGLEGVVIFNNPTGGNGSPAALPAEPTGWDAAPLNDANLQLSVVPVPEPATFALAGLGAAAMLIFRRRK